MAQTCNGRLKQKKQLVKQRRYIEPYIQVLIEKKNCLSFLCVFFSLTYICILSTVYKVRKDYKTQNSQ